MPVQRYTLPLPILLLPLWTVRPVQSLSACTTVHFTFTYTSTPPMDRTDCTEPQCLYKDTLFTLNPIYPLLALLGVRHTMHVSRIRVNLFLLLRRQLEQGGQRHALTPCPRCPLYREPEWTVRKISPSPHRISIPGPPSSWRVAIRTELYETCRLVSLLLASGFLML